MKTAKNKAAHIVIFSGGALLLAVVMLVAIIGSLEENSTSMNKMNFSLEAGELPEIISDEIITAAIYCEEKYEVPASITLAQIIVHGSGSYKKGMSKIAYQCKNLFEMQGNGPA